ncbi:hypothetical protein ACJJTC_002269 [Scirpophaga incertulas]
MNCMTCNESLTAKQTMKCKLCSGKYHYKCLNITKKKFEALPKEQMSNWICPTCKNNTQSTVVRNERCASCKKYFDLNCAEVSGVQFDIVERAKKEGWRCRSRLEKEKQSNVAGYTVTPLSSNITKRKRMHKATLFMPLHKSEEEESAGTDDDLHSMPDISTSTFQNEKELELIKEINQLKLELQIAHNEVENLIKENGDLKKQISEKDKLTVKWKKLFTESINTPKKRNSIANQETSEKKSTRKLISQTLDLNNCSIEEEKIINLTPKHKSNVKSGLNQGTKMCSNENQNPSKNKVVIFSDSVGKGIAGKLIEKTDSRVINTCKPDAGFNKILENCKNIINYLNRSDTVALLITKYENNIYYQKQKYLQLLNGIISEKNRKFNVIVTGLRYNGTHNEDIYNINIQIANMAKANEKVKFIDPNVTYENIKNYIKMKTYIIENVIANINNKFYGTSNLRFINYQELSSNTKNKNSNFQVIQKLTQKQ